MLYVLALIFTLRNGRGIHSLLLKEGAFDEKPWAENQKEPEYMLHDLSVTGNREILDHLLYSVWDYIFLFFVFCFAGWVWECSLSLAQHHVLVNRGTLHGPWIPIYGIGGTLMVLLDRFRHNKVKLVALETVICGALEYTASFLLDYLFNDSCWSYKGMLFNLNGRICLAGLIDFAIGGLIAIYIVAPLTAQFMKRIPLKKQKAICMILIALFSTDVIWCMIHGFNAGAGIGGKI